MRPALSLARAAGALLGSIAAVASVVAPAMIAGRAAPGRAAPGRAAQEPAPTVPTPSGGAAPVVASGSRDHLVVQLGDRRQAQFAGYYVAAARGLYTAAGLDVTLLPGPPEGDDRPLVPRSGIDLWSAWLPQALAADATPAGRLVNIAQIFPHSGLELVCRKGSGIHSPADFRGRTIAIWPGTTQVPFRAWMAKLGLAVPGDVTPLVVPRASGPAGVAPLLDRAAACITALNYDQYWSLIAAGLAGSDLQVFHYGDAGTATLQDGLYATAASLADPARKAIYTRFLAASLRGWSYAVAHQAEAVAILRAGAPPDPAEDLRQARMMSSVARLTDAGLQRPGYLEPAAYDRTVQLLTRWAGPLPAQDAQNPGAQHPAAQTPVTPVQGWTHEIWKHAHP